MSGLPGSVTVEQFDAMASTDRMRPILCMGCPKEPSEGEWHTYIDAVYSLAGLWNKTAHGVFTHLPITTEWLDDELYVVPYEHVMVRADWPSLARGGGGYVERDHKSAIKRALGGIPFPVDLRWKWNDEPTSWQRLAAAAFTSEVMSRRSLKNRVYAALDEKL